MGFRFDSLQPQEKEAVAIWETLRRLGFSADQIGAGRAPDGQAMVNVTRSDGAIFSLMLGPLIDSNHEQFVRRWREAVMSIYAGSCDPEKVQELLRGSQVFQRMTGLIQSLMARGFLDDDGNVIVMKQREPGPGDLVINTKGLKS